MSILRNVVLFIRAPFCDRAELAAEYLVLRQQFAISHETAIRPKLRRRDRTLLAMRVSVRSAIHPVDQSRAP